MINTLLERHKKRMDIMKSLGDEYIQRNIDEYYSLKSILSFADSHPFSRISIASKEGLPGKCLR